MEGGLGSLEETYAQKTHNQNWVRFFWPAWSAVAEQPQFVFHFYD